MYYGLHFLVKAFEAIRLNIINLLRISLVKEPVFHL